MYVCRWLEGNGVGILVLLALSAPKKISLSLEASQLKVSSQLLLKKKKTSSKSNMLPSLNFDNTFNISLSHYRLVFKSKLLGGLIKILGGSCHESCYHL